MSTTIVRRLAVTVSRALNSGLVNSMCALLCHTKKTQDNIYDSSKDDSQVHLYSTSSIILYIKYTQFLGYSMLYRYANFHGLGSTGIQHIGGHFLWTTTHSRGKGANYRKG